MKDIGGVIRPVKIMHFNRLIIVTQNGTPYADRKHKSVYNKLVQLPGGNRKGYEAFVHCLHHGIKQAIDINQVILMKSRSSCRYLRLPCNVHTGRYCLIPENHPEQSKKCRMYSRIKYFIQKLLVNPSLEVNCQLQNFLIVNSTLLFILRDSSVSLLAMGFVPP